MTEDNKGGRRLRSQDWFDNPDHIDMTALYLERFMNYGTTPEELRSGKPIIGIAQSGSDLTPCNRHHIELAKRVRDGIRDAGGIPIEFPTHPIFENCKRPTAALDRNLAYLGLVEILYGYPLDGVVLTTGCDKTTPSALMAASTVDIPAIVLSGGPMLDGWHEGELGGIRHGDLAVAAQICGRRDRRARNSCSRRSIPRRRRPLQYDGHRLDDECACRSARHVADRLRRHSGCISRTRPDGLSHRAARRGTRPRGYQAVGYPDARGFPQRHPHQFGDWRFDQRAAASGCDGEACRRRTASRRLAGAWLRYPAAGQCPAGRRLSRRAFHRAGGTPAIMWELLQAGKLDGRLSHGDRQDDGRKPGGPEARDREVILPFDAAAEGASRFPGSQRQSLRFRDHEDERRLGRFPRRYLQEPGKRRRVRGQGRWCSMAPRTITSASTTHELDIDENTILVIRGAGPLGWPGSAEVVNMQPPDHLLKRGILSLPTIGDGRQSGTADSPSILNASPESAAGGGLAWLRTGDVIRIDFNHGRCDMLVDEPKSNGARRGHSAGSGRTRRRGRDLSPLRQRSCPTAQSRGAAEFRQIAKNPPRHNH
jgi:hypothetical protein